MKHKKVIIYTVVISSLVLLICCAPAIVSKTTWQSKPVVVDGQTNDWEIPLRFFDEKTKLGYSVTNDGENLYICVRATDDENVQGITRRGLQLWIDTTGKKGHQVGILFPLIEHKSGNSEGGKKQQGSQDGNTTADNQQKSSFMDMPDTAKENRMHRRFMENAKQMHVSGFKTVPDGVVELPDVYSLNLAVSWNSYNVLVYEASIPFKSFLKNPKADSSRVLGITFSFSVTPKRTQSEGGGGMHGGHGGGGGMGMGGGMGGGGMGGGGMHGGGGHGGGGGGEEPEQESVWMPFQISTGR
jgi:hypothetical protein